MNKTDAVAVVLLIGVTMYAVFGGADFGAGLWSLLAGRGERGRRPRCSRRRRGGVGTVRHLVLRAGLGPPAP